MTGLPGAAGFTRLFENSIDTMQIQPLLESVLYSLKYRMGLDRQDLTRFSPYPGNL